MKDSILSRLPSMRVREVVARALRLYFAPLRKNPAYEGGTRRARHRAMRISLLLVVMLGATFGAANFLLAPPFGERIATAEKGETVQLSDGSVVVVSPNTRMRVRYGAGYRRIYLKTGAGIFKVARAPSRPFDVITRVGAARAVGTEFSAAYWSSHLAEFEVMAGEIQVKKTQHDVVANEAGGGYRRVVAGQRASIADGKLEILPRGIYWQGEALEIRGATIGAVAAHLNQREFTKIVIADPSVAALIIRPMILNRDAPQTFVEHLADSPNILATYEGDVLHLKSRPGACPDWLICADAQ
jgi:transmembrane sensor